MSKKSCPTVCSNVPNILGQDRQYLTIRCMPSPCQQFMKYLPYSNDISIYSIVEESNNQSGDLASGTYEYASSVIYIHPSLPFIICISISGCLYLSTFPCRFVALSLCLFVSLSLCPSVSVIYLHPSLPCFICISISGCLYLSTFPCRFVSLSLCLSVSFSLSVSPVIYLLFSCMI